MRGVCKHTSLTSGWVRFAYRSFIVCALSMPFVAPALATMDNTATVTGTPRAGTLPPNIEDTESVDLIDAAPSLTINKTHQFAPGGDVNGNGLFDVGDTVRYVYEVNNNGNVTVEDITIADTHDGSGSLVFGTPTLMIDGGLGAAGMTGDSTDDGSDSDWDRLGPFDQIQFTADYVITQTDFDEAGGPVGGPTPRDGDLDNSAIANGTYNNTGAGTTVPVASPADTDTVVLNITPSLTLTKTASADTDVPAGTTITYTYEVVNDGNTVVTDIELNDAHEGSGTLGAWTFTGFTGAGAGSSTYTTGNVIDVLAVGTTATFTRTYTVTQDDVDTLQ